MKRLAPKIAMKRKIAMKKKATPEKLKVRAMKQARDVVRAKFVKGKSYDELSYSEKIQLDKKVETKQALIKKIAKKLLPKIKKAEAERIKNLKKTTEEKMSIEDISKDLLKSVSSVIEKKTVNKVADKAKVLKAMLKSGSNKAEAEAMLKKHYDYVAKKYADSPPNKKAEIIVTLAGTAS